LRTDAKSGILSEVTLRFGVDPFFYFEQYCKIPSIPPLIYEWQVNSIEQDTTPYILSNVARYETRANAAAKQSVERPKT
jgi:hypothetical protein